MIVQSTIGRVCALSKGSTSKCESPTPGVGVSSTDQLTASRSPLHMRSDTLSRSVDRVTRSSEVVDRVSSVHHHHWLDSSDIWLNRELSMVSSLSAAAMTGVVRAKDCGRRLAAINDDEGTTSSDSSDELQYGPGIVSKLKHKYLSMALRETVTRPSLRRVSSFENVVEQSKSTVAMSQQTVAQRRGRLVVNESMKRTRSVGDIALSLQRNEKPTLSVSQTVNCFSGKKEPCPATRASKSTMEETVNERKLHFEKKTSSSDLPLPDTVKTVKKIFESTPSKPALKSKSLISSNVDKKISNSSYSMRKSQSVPRLGTVENSKYKNGRLSSNNGHVNERKGEFSKTTSFHSSVSVSSVSVKFESNRINVNKKEASSISKGITKVPTSKPFGVNKAKENFDSSMKKERPVNNRQFASKTETIKLTEERKSFDSISAKQPFNAERAIETSGAPLWNHKQVGVIKPTPKAEKSGCLNPEKKLLNDAEVDIVEKEIDSLDRKIKETNAILKSSDLEQSKPIVAEDKPPLLPPRKSTLRFENQNLQLNDTLRLEPAVSCGSSQPLVKKGLVGEETDKNSKNPLRCEVQPLVDDIPSSTNCSDKHSVELSHSPNDGKTQAAPAEVSNKSKNGLNGTCVGSDGDKVSTVSSNPPPATETQFKWNSPQQNSVFFDFSSRKDVPDCVDSTGFITSHRPFRPKKSDTGYVLLPGFDPGQTSDDDISLDDRPPSPCDVTFTNADVIINGHSSLRRETVSRKLVVRFDVNACLTHQYLSESSALIAFKQYDSTLGSLSTYTPSKLPSEESFELGISPSATLPQNCEKRLVSPAQPSACESQELLPAAEQDTSTWSASSTDHMLF